MLIIIMGSVVNAYYLVSNAPASYSAQSVIIQHIYLKMHALFSVLMGTIPKIDNVKIAHRSASLVSPICSVIPASLIISLDANPSNV
jgi:hypothetical protein